MHARAHTHTGARSRVRGGVVEGEREGESQADSTLNAEPAGGLDLKTLRSWPEPKPRVISLTDWST